MMLLVLSFVIFLYNAADIDGILLDGDLKGIEYDGLQKCMTKYSNTNQQELSDCMATGNASNPDLCRVTLDAFNCNLNFIMKTCPSRATFYKTYNYNVVKSCNATFVLPGSEYPFPGVVTSSGNSIRVSLFVFGLAVCATFFR